MKRSSLINAAIKRRAQEHEEKISTLNLQNASKSTDGRGKNAKPRAQIVDGEGRYFNGLAEAATYYGLSKSTVCSMLSRKTQNRLGLRLIARQIE